MALVILIATLLIISMFFLSKVNEIKSEESFEKIISTIVDNKNVYFKNIELINDDGDSVSANVILTRAGLFIIDAYEELNGGIYGDDDKFYWTQVLEHRKLNIVNPIIGFRNFSNEFKIKYSRDFRNLKINFIYCLSKKSNIKVKSKHHIVYLSEIKKVIDLYKEEIFNDDEMNLLISILEANS